MITPLVNKSTFFKIAPMKNIFPWLMDTVTDDSDCD